jgi:peptidoglycan glycosyltransferase
VINPKTGAIQALAQRSSSVKNLLLHTGMPAASLIKVVTTAAALETSTMSPAQLFRFRGGTYTLNKWNYKSDRRDNRIMSVTEALGRSCNPIFSRVALSFLSPPTLTDYVAKFGFNTNLKFDLPLPESPAVVPNGEYEFGRTAAGFGDVYISPIHAAAFVGALANHGEMQRPYLVEKVLSANGERLYEAAPQSLGQTVDPHTARTLLNMMEATTTKGTSRGEFFINSRPRLPGVRVAAKTGTLNGGNPSGMTHWFVAAAPLENPTIALAILTIDAGRAATPPARIGRMILEHLKKRKAL